MQKMFGITEYSLLNTGPPGSLPKYDPVQVPPDDPRRNKAYIDLRGSIGSPELMLEALQPYVNASTTDNVLVVSLGDEIGVSDPNPNNTNAAAYANWCAAEGHTGNDIVHVVWNDERIAYSMINSIVVQANQVALECLILT